MEELFYVTKIGTEKNRFHILTRETYCNRKYSQAPILTSPHFCWVVKYRNAALQVQSGSLRAVSPASPAFLRRLRYLSR